MSGYFQKKSHGFTMEIAVIFSLTSFHWTKCQNDCIFKSSIF